MDGKYAARTDREHWAKEIFRAYQIPLWSVARRMGISYPHLCHVLNGNMVVTEKQEAKIRELVQTILSNKRVDHRDAKKRT